MATDGSDDGRDLVFADVRAEPPSLPPVIVKDNTCDGSDVARDLEFADVLRGVRAERTWSVLLPALVVCINQMDTSGDRYRLAKNFLSGPAAWAASMVPALCAGRARESLGGAAMSSLDAGPACGGVL